MGKETLLSYFNISKPTFIFIDAHQSGLSAILALGSDKDNAKPVALASRCTSKAEKNYAQLDLEAMAADFALRRFRLYLVRAPNNTIIVTDHHPLLSVFNGKKNGSIRTDCIKLMTPGFSLQYKKGITQSANYSSRHGIPWETPSKNEKNESTDLANLLYILPVTPILEAIRIKEIAEETNNDQPCRT